MCFSLLRAHRHGIHALSSLWQDSLHRTSKTHGSHWRFNVISPKPNELEGGYSRRWIRSATTLNDTRQQLAERKDLHKLLTVIVFDIETTGFQGQFNRIVEIAFRDLGGGENSTFETLVYPERPICNSYFHGINDDMVMKDGVPRMEELIPIMVQYIESRRKQDGHVLLVAHNGRSFDVPFLKCEFERCNSQIPADWFFCDSLPLARKVSKNH
ncbi:unnamed protein product [Linum trigynum]|uniref:Exonuclease domain-containing protein n=1 Tax=Linum trigynum TaxID=586398 RepID=A0AAV2F4V6_9ROSI